MRVFQAIHGLDRNSGGASTYMELLAEELVNFSEVSVTVAAVDSGNNIDIDPVVKTIYTRPSGPPSFGYSSDYKGVLERSDAEIFHGNGLWQYPVHAMAKFAQKKKKPYIISPHGMLEPWSLTQNKFKKKMLMTLFQKKDIKQSRAIHVTSELEASNVRALGFDNPIAIIPNGINTREFCVPQATNQREKKTLLFLSRIHKKKGIELLINAWEALPSFVKSTWQVRIAGDGERGYIDSLCNEVDSKNLSESIKFIGPVWGPEKIKLYQSADLFVLPTYSENFGIVVAEALSCGVPVITTKGAPWEELESHHCGWWTDVNQTSFLAALERALSMSPKQLKEMGQRGRGLVEGKYDIHIVAQQMIELYNWLLLKSSKPQFVV